MKPPIDRLFAIQDLRDNPLIAMHVVMGTRLCFLYMRAGRDPLPDLAVRLRSMRAAQAQQALVHALANVWPEHFTIRRPCCMTMSPDEMLVADVAAAAMRGERGAAMDAMRDMLTANARSRLFQDMVELVDAIRSVPARQTGEAS